MGPRSLSKLKKKGGSAMIVIFPEGGWGMGDLSERRLAPEHPFPTWINDSWDALSTPQSSVPTYLSRGFVIVGGSAGANITAVLTHIARDEELLSPLTGQSLIRTLPLRDDRKRILGSPAGLSPSVRARSTA
ncbi:hypothetical protein HYALB_00002048 [Hymenoscyphus albidus]|uniref:Alpha/beta hydrolase fold-3 domain-containing protein n=1 Tax=Hymenoscyphus albidus TaxID=595503 RepID=A0A9N9LA56_9HELO|nr:hypothetical protein HYALB_00002048 [Hymenoscyphus albidus]